MCIRDSANGTQEDEKVLLANLDKLGGPDAVPNFGYGWTWATNAPFRLAKQYASHLGGTRNGMVVSWPPVSYTHLRAHETVLDLGSRLLLEKNKKEAQHTL